MPHLTADLPIGWQGEKRTPLGPGDLAVLFREAPYELSFNELGLQVLMDGKPLKGDSSMSDFPSRATRPKKVRLPMPSSKSLLKSDSIQFAAIWSHCGGEPTSLKSTSTRWLRSIWG
jgi:hypothetical protein